MPIRFRSIERRDTALVAVVEETVGQDSIVRTLEFDEATFAGLERAFATHPFRRKRPENDVLLFRSLITPLESDQKYLGLQIVNEGSRHQLQIEASDRSFALMQSIFESWRSRFEAARGD